MKYRLTFFLLTASLGLFSASGCGGESAADEQPKVVYVCEESKQLVEAPQQPTPAEHPETGKATLLRALYCEACKKWHVVPPSELYPKDPLSYPCPRHKAQMKPDGPMEAPIQMGKKRRRFRR